MLAEPCGREFGAFVGKLFGLGVLAEVDRGQRPIHQRDGKLGRPAADPRAQCRQHTVEIGTGLLRPPTKAVHLRLQHQGAQGLRMDGAERPGRLGHRACDHRLGRTHVAQCKQALADHVRQLDARTGLARERRVESLVGLLQQIDRGELLRAAASVRAGLAKDRGDEVLDVLGPLALRHCDARLPERRAGAADHREQQRRRGADGEPIAHDELADSIPGAVRPREHRAHRQMALDVLGHRVDRRVTLGDRLLQGLRHDGVEVASQRSPRSRIGDRLARPRRFGGEDRLFERGPRVALQPVRPGAGQQLEQQHTERIHVGARAHRAGRRSAPARRSRASARACPAA